MSVILTACRNSKQKAIEKAVKKKAAKKREKREAAMTALTEKLAVSDLEGENNVKIWTFLLNGEPTSVVLLAGKTELVLCVTSAAGGQLLGEEMLSYGNKTDRDSLEVACNGDVVESTSDFCHCGAVIDFTVGSRKAQITSSQSLKPHHGLIYALAIEGCLVPDVYGGSDFEATI